MAADRHGDASRGRRRSPSGWSCTTGCRFVSGFDRPNVTFDVVSVEGKGRWWRASGAALLHVLADERRARPAIVYCGHALRDTDAVAARACPKRALATVAYHAGMSPDDRRASPGGVHGGSCGRWVVGDERVLGMGCRQGPTCARSPTWALPTSLEAYYQGGRTWGGRDGLPGARALLAGRRGWTSGRLIRFIKERETSVEDVKAYVGRLRRAPPTATNRHCRSSRSRRTRPRACCRSPRRSGRRRIGTGRPRRPCWCA